MHTSTEPIPLSGVHQYQSAKFNNAPPPSNATYAFLANPPKHKHKPQPISTRCSPPRSLPRATTSRRRSSISGSPAFQASFIAITPTPTSSESPKTPLLTSHGYTASFASFPRRGSIPHVQETQIHLARRVPVSPKRGHSSGSPKRSHSRSPSSPFAPPSPTRMRPRAKSTTRVTLPILPTPPPLRSSKLHRICSLTNLRARSSSPAPPSLRSPSYKPTMTTPVSTTPKATSKRAKRSATPARGSAAFTKYRPMPFIQQMQMIQFLEGGTLDSHIRRHHVHAGQGTAHTGFATGGKEDVAHGYSFTDERGMIWFDEEEEWEFTSLLPRTRQHCRRGGIKRLLGRRRDEESGDEWEYFVEEEELDEDVDAEILLAREDDELRVRDDDLASFGGALEGTWANGRSGSSVLEIPKSKIDRKSKRSRHIVSSTPVPLPEPMSTTTRSPRERVVTLKEEFLATAFTPPPVQTSQSPTQPSRTTNPFRIFGRTTTSMEDSTSRTLFQRSHRAARSGPDANAAAVSQSFANMSASLRGGDVLDATETFSVPQSPTVEWADAKHGPLPHASLLPPATETSQRTPSPSPSPETRLTSVSPPPAAARRLGIEPSTAVSLQPFSDTTKKQTFRSLKGLKSTKGN